MRISLGRLAGAALAAFMAASGAHAAPALDPAVARAAAGATPVEEAQFFHGGRQYCWYGHGWSGAGWYRCGYAWRRGQGWGGPAGWRGWRHPGWRAPPPRHTPGWGHGRPPGGGVWHNPPPGWGHHGRPPAHHGRPPAHHGRPPHHSGGHHGGRRR